MPIFGRKLTRMFHKVKQGATRMFHKVKRGLGIAGTLLDNPITKGLVEAYVPGASGALDKVVHGIHGAKHLANKVEDIGKRGTDLVHSVTADAHRAAAGARGLAHDHTATALGAYTHDLAHMKHDALQKAKDIVHVAKGDDPQYISYL